jgi:protein-tyrosine phosphatase
MYIDLHCHLLYGIDDGPKQAPEALRMARVLVELGFGAAAPSPHARAHFPGAEACAARRGQLAQLLAQQGVELTLHPSAENYLDTEFFEREMTGKGRHINDTSYVLVELPYESVVPALPDLLFRLRRKGVRPVIAHPERAAEFQEKGRAEQAVRLGAALQLDLGSLIGRYGRAARRTAQRLLGEGLYAIAATDLHAAEGAEKWLAQSLRELDKQAGRQGAKRLLEVNPARVLRDEELLE